MLQALACGHWWFRFWSQHVTKNACRWTHRLVVERSFSLHKASAARLLFWRVMALLVVRGWKVDLATRTRCLETAVSQTGTCLAYLIAQVYGDVSAAFHHWHLLLLCVARADCVEWVEVNLLDKRHGLLDAFLRAHSVATCLNQLPKACLMWWVSCSERCCWCLCPFHLRMVNLCSGLFIHTSWWKWLDRWRAEPQCRHGWPC